MLTKCFADNNVTYLCDDECLVISTHLHRSGLLFIRGGHLETAAMESEETGEENRGTSEEYGQRRRTSGKQALHFWKNYTLVVFALTLVYVLYCYIVCCVASISFIYSRLTAAIQRYGNEFQRLRFGERPIG